MPETSRSDDVVGALLDGRSAGTEVVVVVLSDCAMKSGARVHENGSAAAMMFGFAFSLSIAGATLAT